MHLRKGAAARAAKGAIAPCALTMGRHYRPTFPYDIRYRPGGGGGRQRAKGGLAPAQSVAPRCPAFPLLQRRRDALQKDVRPAGLRDLLFIEVDHRGPGRAKRAPSYPAVHLRDGSLRRRQVDASAGHRAFPAKGKITEILVFCEQETILLQRERNDVGVTQTRSRLRDVEHILTSGSQKHDQRRRDAFVGKPAHGSAVNDIFVCEIVGGKGLRGKDIVQRQSWMIHEDRLRRHTGTELAQHKLHRNARAANNRFAIHDIRVSFDPLVRHDLLSVRSSEDIT